MVRAPLFDFPSNWISHTDHKYLYSQQWLCGGVLGAVWPASERLASHKQHHLSLAEVAIFLFCAISLDLLVKASEVIHRRRASALAFNWRYTARGVILPCIATSQNASSVKAVKIERDALSKPSPSHQYTCCIILFYAARHHKESCCYCFYCDTLNENGRLA